MSTEGPRVTAPEVSVILATLNEARCLPVLLPQLEAILPDRHEVVVVDDGSTDGTREFLAAWAKDHSSLRLLLNSGRQTTLRAQVQGLRSSGGRLAVVMDSDLQHPASVVPDLLAPLRAGAQLTVGSRYIRGGSTGKRSAMRGIISRVAAKCAQAAIPASRPLTDPMSGFLAFRSDVIPRDVPVHGGFKILLFLLASNPPLRVAEVPFEFHERESGSSKVVQDMDFVGTFLTEVLRDRRLMARRARPASAPSEAGGTGAGRRAEHR